MSIFESLENLNVSEECFDDIVSIVEEIISENAVDDYYQDRINKLSYIIKHNQKKSKKTGQPDNTAELKDELNKLENTYSNHQKHVRDSEYSAKKSIGLENGNRIASGVIPRKRRRTSP